MYGKTVLYKYYDRNDTFIVIKLHFSNTLERQASLLLPFHRKNNEVQLHGAPEAQISTSGLIPRSKSPWALCLPPHSMFLFQILF